MKKLTDIITLVKDGGSPTSDEMRYAICALDALITFDSQALLQLAKGMQENRKPILIYSANWQWEEHHRRMQRALSKSPKEWVGEDNNPDNPEVQKRRKTSLKILNHCRAAMLKKREQNGTT